MSDETSTGGRGFRPSARRRNRIAAGVALGAAAIGGNVLAYTSVSNSDTAVQVVRDIPAGEQITADMLRVVDADLDGSVAVVPGDEVELLPGRYAKVRIVSGSLIVGPALQADPLVSPGRSVVAVRIADGRLPTGLRERSQVQIVIPSDDAPPTVIEARTVGLPVEGELASGDRSLSLEVDEADGPTVVAADDVRIVLLEPDPDPAVEPSGGTQAVAPNDRDDEGDDG